MTASHPALERFVERLLRRSALTGEEQRAILELPCKVLNFPPRTDIISPGETVDHACLVGKGLVARFDQMRDGKRQIVAFHIPGDMCDLHSVVAPTAAWGMAALTQSTVLHVPHKELRKLALTHPSVALAFWRDGTADASILAKWVGNLGRLDARARVAHVLCELATRLNAAGLSIGRTCFTLDITQEQLADATGLTAVHVNRTMQTLRRMELIATSGRTVNVKNWDGLVETAEFDPDYLLLDDHAQWTTQPAAVGLRLEPPEAT